MRRKRTSACEPAFGLVRRHGEEGQALASDHLAFFFPFLAHWPVTGRNGACDLGLLLGPRGIILPYEIVRFLLISSTSDFKCSMKLWMVFSFFKGNVIDEIMF
jgi:hypothetical protein